MSSNTDNNATHDLHQDRTIGSHITKETVRPEHEERVTRQVEQDIHQHHHKTVEQPLMDREVKGEQHHERTLHGEERTFGSKDESNIKDDMAAARNVKSETQRMGETKHQTQNPDQVSQRVHHHVHEHVQPVVYKETVEPHVTHTTKPVHETHHLSSTHERGTALPAMGVDEFKSGATGSHSYNTRGTSGATGATGTTGTTGTGLGSTRDTTTGEHLGGTDPVGRDAATESDGRTSTAAGKTGSQTSGQAGTQGPHSSSLMNKLDPRVDSTGDGKAGFMS